MISTPFCIGTGFMKCVDITRDETERSLGSDVVDAAILVIEMEEVFVARTAWEGQILANWEKISVFNLSISGTASMTKSTLERSSKLVVGWSRERIDAASSFDSLSFATSFSKSLSGIEVN